MKKIVCLISILMLLSLACNLMNIIKGQKITEPGYENLEQEVLSKTYSISKEYVALRFRTDNVLVNAEQFADYEQWDEEMGDCIIRSKTAINSEPWRPPNPEHVGHPFRAKAATF